MRTNLVHYGYSWAHIYNNNWLIMDLHLEYTHWNRNTYCVIDNNIPLAADVHQYVWIHDRTYNNNIPLAADVHQYVWIHDNVWQ